MRVFLFLLCILAFLASAGIFSTGRGAIHEILGAVFLLMSCIFLVGAAIVEAVNNGTKKIIESKKLP